MEPHTELCASASTRIYTLVKQIGAFHITKNWKFNIEIIRKRLRTLRKPLDDKQEELIDLLGTLTEGINDGKDVISAVKENREQIQRLLRPGNPELIEVVEKAIKSTTDEEKLMRALELGLMHEILSLFGPKMEFKLLFPKGLLDYFDKESIQDLRAFYKLRNEITNTGRNLRKEEKEQFLNYYRRIIAGYDFPVYFPLQPSKPEEYMEMKVTIKALGDVLHYHKQSLLSKAAKEPHYLEIEKISLAEFKAILCGEGAEMGDQTHAARNSCVESLLKQFSEENEKAYKQITDDFKKKYEALELAKVKKSVAELIFDSNSLTSDLRGPQVVSQAMREQISDKLDEKLATINENWSKRLPSKYEAFELAKVAKLISDSNTLMSSLRGPQVDQLMREQISRKLDDNHAEINELIQMIGEETDAHNPSDGDGQIPRC